MSSEIKVVLFDIGGVLAPNLYQFWKELELNLGLSAKSISEALFSDELHRLFHILERGEITLDDFESIFTHFYNKKHKNGSQSKIPLFSSIINSNGLKIGSAWITLIHALRAEGLRCAVLTNNFFIDRARRAETLPFFDYQLFEIVFESCRLGMRKPEERIYKHVANTLKVEPKSIVFIDDLGENLKSAKSFGFATIKHKGIVKDTVAELEKLVGFTLQNFVSGTEIVSKEHSFNEIALFEYLQQTFPHSSIFGTQNASSFNDHNFFVRKFCHGQSNPTFYVNCCGNEFVLRKQPSGRLLPKAHLIDREYRIQKALEGVFPVARTFDYVEGVLDTPFYLMEYCKGRIFTDPNLSELLPDERSQVYQALCEVLARLHAIDFKKIGLEDYGRPTGYVKRNLTRLIQQYNLSRSLHTLNINQLIDWLQKNAPDGTEQWNRQSIVHGDFRLDNVVFHPTEFRIIAVLDWELSTLGDPLCDLATLLIIYYFPIKTELLKGIDLPHPAGISNVTQFFHNYVKQSTLLGVNSSLFNGDVDRFALIASTESPLPQWWTFYLAFAAFRNAIIVVGLIYRLHNGQASNPKLAASTLNLPDLIVKNALQIISCGSTLPDASKSLQSQTLGFKGFFPTTPDDMSDKAQIVYRNVHKFIFERIIPMENLLHKHGAGNSKWTVNPQIEKLKAEAKLQGLWNLFITKHLDPANRFGGAQLTTVEFAHICELTGLSPFAPEVFNCSAPDTGNMEVLIKYGTEAQQNQFLFPLLDGKWRSCFAMTEPDVASSDATNIQATIVRDKSQYLLNARKWFTSGALHPNCRVCIYMGRILNHTTKPKVSTLHRQQSMILVNFNSPGIKIVRALDAIGLYDAPGGHAELTFENVCVPVENLLLGEGRGFEIAQGRLGPGRIHHCMRLIGHAQRALHLMKERVRQRVVHGKPLTEFQNVRIEIAQSRIDIEQARLLVLKTAQMIDAVDTKKAAAEIAMIKVVTPNMALRVIDRAIQHFGAGGTVSADWPLVWFYVWARVLRLADGPDIVHLETLAKVELAKSHL